MDSNWLPTKKIIEDYDLYREMLRSLAIEVRELSKKKQEGTLNLTKVRMINRILTPLKEEILMKEPSAKFLDLLDESILPSNSDAVLIISQYESAIDNFKETYYQKDEYQSNYSRNVSRWITQEEPQDFYKEEVIDEDDENEGQNDADQ